MTGPIPTVFKVVSWNEAPYDEPADGPRLTRARVEKTFAGELAGASTVEYLMMHRSDGTATFVGYERANGTLRGRSGSAVFRHEGTFEAGVAHTEWAVVPGSGTGGWTNLRGSGRFSIGHAAEYSIALDLTLD